MAARKSKEQIILDLKYQVRMLKVNLNKRVFDIEAEKRIEERTRLLKKKPDYHTAWFGGYIFNNWRHGNKFTIVQTNILIIMSYYKFMFWRDLKIWYLAYDVHIAALKELTDRGYITKIAVPAKTKGKTREAYALTPMGVDLEKDFEKFFDTKYGEIHDRKSAKKYKFDLDDYFRMVQKPKFYRRLEQGGGRLPPTKGAPVLRTEAYWQKNPVKYPDKGEENGKT